jgi:cell wall assembly regulator SMI1
MIDDLFKLILKQDIGGVRGLLAQGENPNQTGSTGASGLFMAAMYGNTDIVALLLSAGALPNIINPRNESTPLIQATERGHLDVVRLLIQAGADVHYQNRIKQTPLSSAVNGNTDDHLEIVRLLVKASADVNAGVFYTMLMLASGRGSPAIVKELIAAGANINQCTNLGTALVAAVDSNRPHVVALLLDAGADPWIAVPVDSNAKEYRGKTPLEIAWTNGQPTIRRVLEERMGLREPSVRAPIDSFGPDSVRRSWERIEEFCRATLPGGATLFAPPVTEEDLVRAEQELGVTLPEDFKASYRIHNGQLDRSPGIILPHARTLLPVPRYRFMPLQSVIHSTKCLREVAADLTRPSQRTAVELGIQPAFWLPDWIPFASNGGGDYLCVDLSPAPEGTVGQVLDFNHEKAERPLLARSLAEFLDQLITALECGDRYCR